MFLQDNVWKLFFFRKTLSSIYFSEWNQTKKEKKNISGEKNSSAKSIEKCFCRRILFIAGKFCFFMCETFFSGKNLNDLMN